MKKNQKFAKRDSANYTIPPEFWTDMPTVESMDSGIKLVDTKEFYPYRRGTCGGRDVQIYVFKATKKGTFQIKFDTETIKVIVN